jgi:hypothetical protein
MVKAKKNENLRKSPRNVPSHLAAVVVMLIVLATQTAFGGQAETGGLSGVITDANGAAIAGATVTVRRAAPPDVRVGQTDADGRYRFDGLAAGEYVATVDASGFAAETRAGVTVAGARETVASFTLKIAAGEEVVTVTGDAPLLNATNAEVGARFDAKRLNDVPLAPNGNVYSALLTAPGVSQLGPGQPGFSNGVNFSSNGSRLRSNNFLIDGQDNNDPNVSGAQQPLNNPDLIQEVRILTNQFGAEFGRNSGAVVNVVTKSGGNEFHGSLFYFYNGNVLNARSNLDKAAGREGAPFRAENRFGGSFGGPIRREKTFFFGTFQRTTDRAVGSGFTLNGSPTEEGRRILQTAVGNRPQVAALLRFLPAAATPTGRAATFAANGATFTVPLGGLTGSTNRRFDNTQLSGRADHSFNERHKLTGAYLFSDETSAGTGQVTPSGLTTVTPLRAQTVNLTLHSDVSSRAFNEFRLAYSRLNVSSTADDPAAAEIPSIEVNELGLVGFNASANRTAIGLAINLPQARINNTYQIAENLTYAAGVHTFKFGADITRRQQQSFLVMTLRGRLSYSTLQQFVDDNADLAATINRPLPGGATVQDYEFTDAFGYAQDEWKIRPNVTLTLGLRYETPGNAIASLFPINDRIAAQNGDAFRLDPRPRRDVNNFAPRFGFNWNPRVDREGLRKRILGGDRTVVRGGYSRAYDASFVNIGVNIFSAFPFFGSIRVPARNAFTGLQTAQFSGNPRLLNANTVAADFRSPYTDQYSLEIQRQVSASSVVRVGYVGTKGTALLQTIDGNPALPRARRMDPLVRVDPTRGAIRERANSASSIYHSLQLGFERRFSRHVSANVSYVWSAFIDDASEVANNSAAVIVIAQDSFNRRADRGRSSFDRPHVLTGSFFYESPFFERQDGVRGRLLGGWQVGGVFTFQSGAPFTILNGADPTGALQGIDDLAGNSVRPNLNTPLNLSSLSVAEIRRAGGARLFSSLPASGGVRLGAVGRNTVRSDGIGNIDVSVFKNTRLCEGQTLQFRLEMFNATNTRNFSIPDGRLNSPGFLDEGATDGGNRRIVAGLRYVF